MRRSAARIGKNPDGTLEAKFVKLGPMEKENYPNTKTVGDNRSPDSIARSRSKTTFRGFPTQVLSLSSRAMGKKRMPA